MPSFWGGKKCCSSVVTHNSRPSLCLSKLQPQVSVDSLDNQHHVIDQLCGWYVMSFCSCVVSAAVCDCFHHHSFMLHSMHTVQPPTHESLLSNQQAHTLVLNNHFRVRACKYPGISLTRSAEQSTTMDRRQINILGGCTAAPRYFNLADMCMTPAVHAGTIIHTSSQVTSSNRVLRTELDGIPSYSTLTVITVQ